MIGFLAYAVWVVCLLTLMVISFLSVTADLSQMPRWMLITMALALPVIVVVSVGGLFMLPTVMLEAMR